MAQKNFTQMSSKKLNALLATASEEDKVLIQEVLNKRNKVSANDQVAGAPDTASTELTLEEQEAIEKAEGNAVKHSESELKKHKANKMTDEQRIALANELRGTVVNHRCQVVPFNTLEWVDGVIVGIIEEKRSNKVLYAVKTDDGRRIVKAYGSELIKISDEVVNVVKVSRGRKQKLDADGNPINSAALEEWTDEEIEAAIKEVIDNVGKTVSYPKTGAMGVAIEGVTETGRIVSLVPNKRQHTILYRIEVDQPDADEKAPKKYAHKVASNTDLVIADEFDEAGEKINASFVSRRYNSNGTLKVKMTPAEALEAAKAAVIKAEETLAKAQANLEKRKSALEAAQAAFNASENNTEAKTEAETEVNEDENATSNEDLM